MPAGYDLISWYDLSPMRPDEYHRQQALPWHEAVVLRNAIDEGKADARSEHAASQHQFPDED